MVSGRAKKSMITWIRARKGGEMVVETALSSPGSPWTLGRKMTRVIRIQFNFYYNNTINDTVAIPINQMNVFSVFFYNIFFTRMGRIGEEVTHLFGCLKASTTNMAVLFGVAASGNEYSSFGSN